MITVYHDGSAASSPFLDLRKRRRKDIVLGTSSNHRLRSMDWQPSTLCHKGRSRNVPCRILLITEYTGYGNIRSGQLLLGGRTARAPPTYLLMDMEWLRSGAAPCDGELRLSSSGSSYDDQPHHPCSP